MSASNAQPTLLPYADIPGRYGIVYEQGGDTLRIEFPRPSMANRIVGTAVLGACGFVGLFLGCDPSRAWRGIQRLSQRSFIAVTRTSVVVSNVNELDATRPRERVYIVKYVEHARSLVVPARGGWR